MDSSHTFYCKLEWTGTTSGPAGDPQAFDRSHRLLFDGRPPIEASSAPAFQGDPGKLNPEEMLVAALSSCQMLTYLAVMARARQPVLRYEDNAEGALERGQDGKLCMNRVILRPRITLAAGADRAKAGDMIEKAHRNCFIASSVKSEVVIEPVFMVAEAAG